MKEKHAAHARAKRLGKRCGHRLGLFGEEDVRRVQRKAKCFVFFVFFFDVDHL